MALSPSSGSSRRVEVQAMACLVDGCTADLNDCRKYYQRHKVCEFHSKSPRVSINGQVLRFCQQCSRFHPLEEFDEGKRSCRKRLDGHNRRRRKLRPSLFSTNRGTDMLQYSTSQQVLVHPTLDRANPLWSGLGEAPSWVDRSNRAPSLLSSSVAPPQAYTSSMSYVVHPPSDSGSFPITTSPLDQGPSYRGMNSMDPCYHSSVDREDRLKLPFYWRS